MTSRGVCIKIFDDMNVRQGTRCCHKHNEISVVTHTASKSVSQLMNIESIDMSHDECHRRQDIASFHIMKEPVCTRHLERYTSGSFGF